MRNIAAPVLTGSNMPLFNLLATKWNKFKGNPAVKTPADRSFPDILVKASAIILLPIYLHLMTQEEYGVFNYVLSITYSFSVLLNLGLYILIKQTVS